MKGADNVKKDILIFDNISEKHAAYHPVREAAALRFVLQPLYAGIIILALSRLGQNAYLICKAHVLNELYLSFEAAVKLLLGVDVRIIPQQRHVEILRQIFKHRA